MKRIDRAFLPFALFGMAAIAFHLVMFLSFPSVGWGVVFFCIDCLIGYYLAKHCLAWTKAHAGVLSLQESFEMRLPNSWSLPVRLSPAHEYRLIFLIANATLDCLNGKILLRDGDTDARMLRELSEPKPFIHKRTTRRSEMRWPRSTETYKAPLLVDLPDDVRGESVLTLKLDWNFIDTRLESYLIPASRIADMEIVLRQPPREL